MAGWMLVQERHEGFPIHMLYTPVITYSGRVEDAIGTNLGEAVIIFGKNGRFEGFFREKSVKRAERAALQRILKNPAMAPRLLKIFRKKISRFLKDAKTLSSGDLSKAANSEIVDKIRDFWKQYDDAYIYSEPLAFVVKDAFGLKADADVRKALYAAGRKSEFGTIFGTLIAPIEKPFATREEESLLRIIIQIKKIGEVKRFADGKIDASTARLFETHARGFFWVPFDYAGKVWGKAQFMQSARQLILQGFDAKKRLDEIRRYYAPLKKRQKKLEDELHLDARTRIVLETLRITGFIMDYKKECFTKAHYSYRKLLIEAARRLGWSPTQAYSVTPLEMTAALKGKQTKPDKNAVRILHMIGRKAKVLDGNKGASFLRRNGLIAKLQDKVTELKGTCACAGTVKGPAKVILMARDLDKLEAGDVLVTIMTTPDFVRGMKKAAAIVTNDGGITCHAAIVSREFNIPCVVGTRVATKVFRDGDMLEVKASHGVVRKIR